VTFRTIVVALDGSKRSERALPWARLLAKEQDVVLLRVIEQDYVMDVYAGALLPDLIAEGERYLHRVASDFEIRPRLVARVGSVAPTIAEVAREVGADLIALTTHGSSELTRWVFGTTAEKLARHSDTPLLVVPSWEEFAPVPKLAKVLVAIESEAAARAANLGTAVVPIQGSPDQILEAAAREQADLVIAPVRPRTGLSRWWKPDETRQLLRASAVPLLLVPSAPRTAAV
jgi:nucleotide-binding universal stress UspA family protein